MIRPYGSEQLHPRFVRNQEARAALLAEAQTLPSIVVSSAAAANAVMLGGGYFNPLRGFMDKQTALRVADEMSTPDGLFWPVPILNMVHDASGLTNARRIALRDPNIQGNPTLAVMTIECVEQYTPSEMAMMTEGLFRTQDPEHPGVAAFNRVGRVGIAGPLQVLNFSYFEAQFPDTFRTAYEIRHEIEGMGWGKVVAFQTRNPMHRAHEELCRMAKDAVKADGILIHMLLGKLKKGDIPAEVRDAAIRKMVELYFPRDTVLIAGYGFDMLYAGPREAVLHAILRQNCGCTHLIVGRDHAGVGSYYGPFDAQAIFSNGVPKGALELEIFAADHTAYSKKLQRVVMMRDAGDHAQEDFVMLSGTKVRAMLAAGEPLPTEFARSEVAEILSTYYRSEEGRCAS